eukprot:1838305-Amphidinium_carterae.2
MSDHTVALATAVVCPKHIHRAFSSLPADVRTVLNRFGFFASRDSILTLHELHELNRLEEIATELQAALAPHVRHEHDMLTILQELASLGGFTLPTTSVPEQL